MGADGDSEQQPTAAAAVPSMDSVQTLKFPPPSAFDGSEDKFEDFEFKLKGYMSLSNIKFRRMMNVSRDSENPIDYEQLDSDQKAMAIQLQNALVALCSGAALQVIRREEDSDNGFETWRKLCSRFAPSKRSRATGRMNAILNWQFKMDDFENSFGQWESEIERYEKEQGSDFPSEIKIGILLSKAEGQLQQHLLLNTDLNTPYQQVRSIIVNYYRHGRLLQQL